MKQKLLFTLVITLLVLGLSTNAQAGDPTQGSFKAANLGLPCAPHASTEPNAPASADRISQTYLQDLADG